VKRILTAVVLIPLVILTLFKAPLWLFTLLVLGVALLAAREYFYIAEANGISPFRRISYAFLICIFLVGYAEGTTGSVGYIGEPSVRLMTAAIAASLLLVLSPFILLIRGMGRDPLSRSLPDIATSFLMLPYIGLSLVTMILIRGDRNGALFLLFVMLIVWSGDISAYYVGRAVGKHKLAPRISPGKTWEGTIASLLGGVLIALVLFHYLRPIYNGLNAVHLLPAAGYRRLITAPFLVAPIGLVVAFAACINIAAQLGDLVESMLKRGAGVKDSGTLLPGHGGVLDRIDALLFALPTAWLFFFAALGRYFRWTITES
jgi:phosphatidate cytidylyltransferase